MMKKVLAYIPLLLMFLACSEDEQVVPQTEQQGRTIEVPVAITLSGTADSGLRTRTNDGDNPYLPPVSGEATVNTVKLYVFKKEGIDKAPNNQNAGEYRYEQVVELGNITDAEGTHTNGNVSEQDKVATGKITLDTGNSYRILAIAHNKESYGYEANFVKGETALTEAEITLANENNTPELFAGCLYKSEGSDWSRSAYMPISEIDENTQLLGHLYRAVGYVYFELDDVDADVNKLEFWVEKFATSKNIYDQVATAEEGGKAYAYPMGYVNEELTSKKVKVAEISLESNDDRAKAVFGSFFFPLDDLTMTQPATYGTEDKINNRGHFYIKATKSDGTETEYIVGTSVSEWINTIWHGIQEQLVYDNQFIIPINWKLRIHGTFEELKSSGGNLWIDLSQMDIDDNGHRLDPVE